MGVEHTKQPREMAWKTLAVACVAYRLLVALVISTSFIPDEYYQGEKQMSLIVFLFDSLLSPLL
jgi:uncharacterized membrane-anchored protein